MYEQEDEWSDLKREDPGVLQRSLDQAVNAIELSPAEQGRLSAALVDLALYCGQPFTLMTMSDLWWSYKAIADAQSLKYNAAYSVVNTIVSRICSFRPRAQFIPEAGNYKTQKLCRDRTAACDAWSQREQYQDQASYAFRDCLMGPGGVLKVYLETLFEGTDDEETQTRLGRFPSWEIKVNEQDGRYGEPEFMYHVKWLTQRNALKLYGKDDNARALIVTGADRIGAYAGYGVGDDGLNGIAWRNGQRLIRVVDAYARGPKGRHVIMAGDYIAYDQEWKHRWHPFTVSRFERAEATGFWGRSALDKVRGVQTGLDASVQDIDDAHHLAAKLIATGPMAPEKFTNDIVQYFAGPPGSWQFHNPKPTDPDAYRWFEMKKAWMFEVLGVSPNAAQATKPQGVTAAVAIDAVTDLQSDRLSQLSQMWEQTVVQVGEKWFALESDAAGGDSKRTYMATDRGRASMVDVHADGTTPTIRVFPTSLFGQSVPARLQKAMDAVKAGWFDQEEILKVLGVPDLESIFEIKLAEYEWTEKFCDDLLENGKYVTPTVWANPIKLFEYARLRYLRADTDGSYPKPNMAKMRKLLDYLQPIAQAARDKAAGKAPALPAGAVPGAPALPAGPPAPGAISPAALPPAAPAAPPLPGLTPSPEAAPAP